MLARSLPIIIAVTCLLGCEDKVPEPDATPIRPVPTSEAKPAPTELLKEDSVAGTGPEANTGDKVKVHYTGRLWKNNAKFDSSVGKSPFSFTLGKGEVIKGWDQGVVGMKVGGKRKLTIPADLAYGAKASPKIPANSALVFDVELLEVEGKGAAAGSSSANADGSAAPSAAAAPAANSGSKPAPKKPAPKKPAPAKPAPATPAPAKPAPAKPAPAATP